MFQKILKHKILTGFLVIVVGIGIYFISRGNGIQPPKYVLAAVEKGTLISSVSGSGQVSPSNQVDLKPKASGNITYLGVKDGQPVRMGTVIAYIDATSAQKAVRDAQISLQNAQIALTKLQNNQNSNIPNLQNSITNSQNNLTQAYQNDFNEVANSFLDLPDILSGIRSVLYDATVGTQNQQNTGAYQDLAGDEYDTVTTMINQAVNDYLSSVQKYNSNLANYQNMSMSSTNDQITALANQTLDIVKTMAQTVKDEQNLLDTVTAYLNQYHRGIPSALTQYQSDISSYVSKLNSHVSNLTSIQNTITSNQQSLASAQRDLASAQQSNPLDLASQQNQIAQAQSNLQSAQDNLADYTVTAPFNGIVAKVNVSKGDSISSGTSIATFISDQPVADISLNEVDAAKIAVGDKATLTFDAIPDLTIAGHVDEIDTLGTVNQGVVTYNVKINFDSQDSRVKPNMSVSASIITEVKQDVLMVPSSAVKAQGTNHYVQTLSNISQADMTAAISIGITSAVSPQNQTVEVGSSNDSDVEITSGLKEGDMVVVRTITSSTTTSTGSSTNRSSSTGIPGLGGGGNRTIIGR